MFSALRGLVFLKQNAWSIFRFVSKPILFVGRIFFIRLGVPIYRLAFFLRRQLLRLYIPAKSRFLFLFTNRYVFHAAIVVVAAVTSVVNIQAGEVRAETFGSKSLLYGLVNKDPSGLIEEVSAGQMVPLVPSSYSDLYAVSVEDVDIDLLYEEDLATILGGSAISTPTISESNESLAPRSTVEEYLVQEGDVLGSIAGRFNLSLSSILWANNLTYRSTIRPGQKLIIPPVDGVLYTVKNGDTLSSISKKYSSTSEKILVANNLSSVDSLKIGTSLVLPDATPPTIAPVRYTAPAASVFNGTRGSTAPAAATGGWVWPTDLCTITQYYNGWGHFGLDVDGDYINNIYAARGGTVTRASWFSGYGNCVDINHGDGYVTRYGHLSKFFVSVGDVVGAGDALGKMGTTGNSTGTHLHFEVMEGKTKYNPLNFIRCK